MSSFVGLKNQGATCYLNSLIQTLFLTPEFRQELFSLTPNDVGLNSKRKKIIVELQKLFARLQSPEYISNNNNDTALSTKSLTNAFGWNSDQHMDQHDINELYNILLDGIESQMPINKKILNKYYKGKIVNIIQCQICKNDSKKYEEFVQLNVILQTISGKSYNTLNESLLSSFINNIEELKDDNAYFCINCNKKVNAKKYCRLIQLPNIIVCNLNRFYFDFKSGQRVKINKKFQFPKSFDLSMFIDNEYSEMDKNDITQYDLIGIVVHKGTGANAGHYHAYIRDINNEIIWKPIKRHKKKRRGKKVKKHNQNDTKDKQHRKKDTKDDAVALLVSILSENKQLTKNVLHKKFKASYKHDLYCSFADFIGNNNKFKIIDQHKRNFSICLADNNDIENENEKENKCDDLYAINEPHWFDFNDEDITAIFDTEIDDLYAGGDKECPYMVIYRKKCMINNWPPKIPEFVQLLLMNEPLDADEDKQKININIIKLIKCSNSSPKRKGKNTNKKTDIKLEYLEAIEMTCGNNIFELYNYVSELCVDIDVNNIQIAKIIFDNKNKLKILNFESEKEKNMKIKYIPLLESDNILVWDIRHGNLAQKELLRRKQCICVNVYILNREYFQQIYICKHSETLIDLYEQIIKLLNINERKCIEYKGRIRDIHTKEIYKYCHNLNGISNECILRFEGEKAPNKDEIVIIYRLKTGDIKHAKDANEYELYINKNENINALKILMCNKCNIKCDLFEIRKGRRDWALSTRINCDNNIKIKDLKFNNYNIQRLILVENNMNKNERKLHIYCQIYEINGIKQFKIANNCLELKDENKSIIDKGINAINLLKRPIGNRANNLCSNNNNENSDVIMEENKKEKEKEIIPCNDGLDIYECNSFILCTIIVNKNFNGRDIKKAIIKCNKWNLNIKLKKDLSPLYLRVSIINKRGSKTTWQILGDVTKKIGNKNGKCIVEFFDTQKKDNIFGTLSSGSSLVFVHELIKYEKDKGAIYGKRYEIEIKQIQREKLDALKRCIISQCNFETNMESNDIILAIRNVLTHKWNVLKSQKKNKQKKMRLYPKPFDRDIIGVLCCKNMNKNVINKINGEYFETEWDKYYSIKYEKEKELKRQNDIQIDEPAIIINFDNQSESDEENDEEKDINVNNNNTNNSDNNDNDK